MTDGKGRLIIPAGVDTSGVVHPFSQAADESLNVTIKNTNIMETPHALLDGSIDLDTVTAGPQRGDLVVGNSTPKWDRLPIQASGKILSSNGNDPTYQTLTALFNQGMAGTSFPGSPSVNDVFYRTDLGMFCFWNGTNWLTISEHGHVVPPITRTTSGVTNPIPLRSDYAPYFTRLVVRTNVASPNDGTNYWTVTVSGYNLSEGANSAMYSFDTSADVVATFINREAAASPAIPTNKSWFIAYGATHNSPGSLYITITFFYRLVIA